MCFGDHEFQEKMQYMQCQILLFVMIDSGALLLITLFFLPFKDSFELTSASPLLFKETGQNPLKTRPFLIPLYSDCDACL